MSSLWKLATLLGLLEELEIHEADINDSKKKNRLDSKKKNNKYFPSLPEKPNKSWWIKVLTIGTAITILYFIFGYGSASYIEIKDISCDNSKLKIETHSKGNFVLPEFKNKAEGAYSTKMAFSSQEDVYEVFLYDEHNRKIAFRVSKNSFQKDNKASWKYLVSSGKSFSKCIHADGKDKCCCADDKNCQCSNNKEGTCKCEEGNCACCVFMSWIDAAILNLENPRKTTPSAVFFSLLPTLLYLAFFIFLGRTAMRAQGMGAFGGPGGIFKIGQSLSKTVKSNVTFDDVAGLKEEKVELSEIVDYLRSPMRYKSMGARIPRGVILYGPPGTGKTLLAKAVSGEADVPFIEVSGATFDDMYVGSGAKRVRDLFAKAKKIAPCIVFIDEIDAVAGKRGNKFVSGGGVYDQTINQLLSEMDGFNTADGIVIMAATNKLDAIDEAILRPGRFDRHIRVSLPFIKDRVAILKVHAKNKNLSSSVDLEDVARKTPGFSGAQLENVLNEATLLAVRNNKKAVDKFDIEEAIDRVISGPSKKSHKMTDLERKQIAYHEAGHAISGLYSTGGEVVEKITIIPRGQAAGYMLSAPEKQETFIKRKDELMSMVITTLSGRAAEEIFFGLDRISTGAANDLFKTTNLVRSMITKFGMSEKLGLYQYDPSEGPENPYKNPYSERTAQLIDEEVDLIIKTQYQKAKEIISKHSAEFLLIVECLLLLETIDRNQINFIHKNKQLPIEAESIKKKMLQEGNRLDISPTNSNLIVKNTDV